MLIVENSNLSAVFCRMFTLYAPAGDWVRAVNICPAIRLLYHNVLV